MGGLQAAHFPEMGKVWTRLFGQALIHWIEARVEEEVTLNTSPRYFRGRHDTGLCLPPKIFYLKILFVAQMAVRYRSN